MSERKAFKRNDSVILRNDGRQGVIRDISAGDDGMAEFEVKVEGYPYWLTFRASELEHAPVVASSPSANREQEA